MLINYYLTGQPVFFNDLVQIDKAENTALLFHCGVAPTSLAGDPASVSLTQSSLHHMPGTVEFTLKPGRVTFSKLSLARQGYVMLIAGGEALPTPMDVCGTSVSVRFDEDVYRLVTTIIKEGMEHHYVLAYGDIREELKELSALLGIRTISA